MNTSTAIFAKSIYVPMYLASRLVLHSDSIHFVTKSEDLRSHT